MTSERDQRIMEFATGFALGELDDTELKEFYGLLREPGQAGAEAGQVAWETLGTMIDLRAQMGSSFQDTLYLRLAEGDGEDGRFAAKVRSRLGRSRPRLKPVEIPRTIEHRRGWAPWVAGAMLLLFATIALLWPRGEDSVARVLALAGTVTQGGRGLMVGQAIDRRQLLVPTTAQLTLGWADGSQMTLAGPTSVVAGNEGLSLLGGGQAWWSAGSALTLGLPDRPAALYLPAGSSGAITIRDNRTTVALSVGTLATDGVHLVAGQVLDLSRPGEPYSWQQRTVAGQGVAELDSAVARWRFSGLVAWQGDTSAFAIRSRDRDGGEVVVRFLPGSVVMLVGGRETQRAVLNGAPLAERQLEVIGDETSLSVLVSSQRLELPLSRPISTLSWSGDSGGELHHARFTTGPDSNPPLPR